MSNNTGDFFKQLATVVIGIVITFGGSALIQKCSERNETAHILSMVRDELRENVNLVGMNRSVLIRDSVAAAVLRPCIRNPKLLPVDSLHKYMDAVMIAERYSFLTTSLEVLKSSSQVQAIRNKELLRDLFLAYANMNDLQLSMEAFCSIKEQCISEFLSNMDSEIFENSRTDKDALYMMFADMMKHKLMRNYVTMIAHSNVVMLAPVADSVTTEINRVIARLDKEIAK